MPTRDIFKLPKLLGAKNEHGHSETAGAPLGGTRAEMMQRLQVGLSGIAAMVLLVGLANIIQDRARVTEERAVPDAAATVVPQGPPPLSDPLADAGVVPDLPAEPVPTQSPNAEANDESGADDTSP